MAATWPMIRRTRFSSLFFSSTVCAMFILPEKLVRKALYKDTPAGIRWFWQTRSVRQKFRRREAQLCLTVEAGCANGRSIPSRRSLRLRRTPLSDSRPSLSALIRNLPAVVLFSGVIFPDLRVAAGRLPAREGMKKERKEGGEQNADENNPSGSCRGTLDSESSRSATADGRIVRAPHPFEPGTDQTIVEPARTPDGVTQ